MNHYFLRFGVAFFAALLPLLISVGCNRGKVPGLIPYEGVVTYKGEPVVDGHLSFTPIGSEGRTAYASTDAQGRFKASTIDPNDGLIKGKYKVSVSKNIISGVTKLRDGSDEPIYANLLPAKYEHRTTPIEVEVTKKTLEAKFELTD